MKEMVVTSKEVHIVTKRKVVMPRNYKKWKESRNGLCVQCNNQALPFKLACEKHDSMSKENNKARKQMLIEQNLCTTCGEFSPEPEKRTCQRCILKNRGPAKEYAKRRRKLDRETIFNHYGNKCECCQETNEAFLSIDHVGGGGNKHRRQLKSKGKPFYKWLLQNNFPPGFRLLCMNCQFGTRDSKVCPHQTSVS